MTKLYAVLVGSLLLAGGSSAMARPDADDTLTQIHRLPNEIIGAAELKPVFRFGRRLQDGVSTLSGVQEDGLVAGKNKDDTVSTAKAEAEARRKAEEAMAKAKAYEKTVAKLKAQLADVRKMRADSEAVLKEDLELLEEARRKADEARRKADGWRDMVEKSRRVVEFFKEDEANLEAELKAEEARMKA